jgi:hypothetical protein
MHAILFATFVALGLKLDVLFKDRPTAGLGCISRAYGNERAETIRFVALMENDDPLHGCADCLACQIIATRGRASDGHTCWKKGRKGGEVKKERERRERCAALVAEAEPPANVRLLACPSP